MCRFGFEVMGLERIEANAHVDNIGSNRTLVKAGFTKEDIEYMLNSAKPISEEEMKIVKRYAGQCEKDPISDYCMSYDDTTDGITVDDGHPIDEIDKELLEAARVYRLSFSKKCRALFLPSLEPYFISGIKSSIGLSWKAGIAAEVLCKPALSIGTNIDDTRIYLETPELFAWTAVVIVLSLIFEKLTVFLLKGKERKNEHND